MILLLLASAYVTLAIRADKVESDMQTLRYKINGVVQRDLAYVPAAFQDRDAWVGDSYSTDDLALTVGLSWDLMPSEVRIVEERRAWYEPDREPATATTITIPTSGDGAEWLWQAAVATLTLGAGGGAVAYARRKRNESE